MNQAARARATLPPAGREGGERLRRRSRRALAGSAGTVVVLAGVGALLAAPGDLGAVRLLGVALGWWAVIGALLVVLAILVLDREDGARPGRPSHA